MRAFDSDKDYYSILGAEEDAPRSEIERLYKRLAVLHHPDRGGDEEQMKSLNEAYGVLRDEETRASYDEQRQRPTGARVEERSTPPPYSSPSAQADAVSGQFVAALLFLAVGLVLLFVVRFQYVLFLWPLALLAVLLILVGIVHAHSALRMLRETFSVSHPARRFVMAQEMAFWSIVGGGCYGVYFILRYL
ncbi:MAG TPA: J domain-containing protein [Pyrinomonadaceae bacterium]|jgi:curved DNA-binding protein CbpA|nr:J domain-containing protein [Pyrinomonadaceae bacterium]